jgi:hypothetical protein
LARSHSLSLTFEGKVKNLLRKCGPVPSVAIPALGNLWANHGLRPTHPARQAGASNESAKYCVSCDTFPPLNSMTLTVKRPFAAVVDHVFANPKLTFSYDPPDAKLGGLIRVVAPQCLQILPTVNYLALLRVLANNVIMIDLVFANLITRGRSRPMTSERRPNIVLVHALCLVLLPLPVRHPPLHDSRLGVFQFESTVAQATQLQKLLKF